MLIPQFSLRWMLAVTTLLAVVFLFVAQAVQGASWAVGVSFAFFALAIAMLVYVGLFFVVWVFSVVFAPRAGNRPASPSANDPAASPFAKRLIASPLPPAETAPSAEIV